MKGYIFSCLLLLLILKNFIAWLARYLTGLTKIILNYLQTFHLTICTHISYYISIIVLWFFLKFIIILTIIGILIIINITIVIDSNFQ